MKVEDIRAHARSLNWTRDQALFLSDRIRNALVVLGSTNSDTTSRAEAQSKLLSALEAIEDSAHDGARTEFSFDNPFG